SEPCTSSSDSAATYVPSRTSCSSLSNATSISPSSASVSKPAPLSTRACALEPAISYLARRQSKSVDLLSSANDSAGPSEQRPPQREPSFVPCAWTSSICCNLVLSS